MPIKKNQKVAEGKMIESQYPEAPNHLSIEAKEIYNAYIGNQIRSPGQIVLFITALEKFDRRKEIQELIREQGLTHITPKTGAIHINPLTRLEKEETAQMVKIWKMLNLNIPGKWAKQLSTSDILKGKSEYDD